MPSWKEYKTKILFLSPILIYLTCLFIFPLLLLSSFSFFSMVPGQIEFVKKFTLENYIQLTSRTYVESFTWTIGVALLLASISLISSLPLSYFLAREKGIGKTFIELSLLFPFFGGIFYAYSFLYAFAPQGIVNYILMNLHIIREPLQLFHSELTTIVGLMFIYLPLCTLIIRSAFVAIDPVYEEAALCMGASRLKVFFKITLPLAKTGIAGAFLITFGQAVSAFDVPYIMAGPYNRWLSSKIWQEMFFFMNYPFAAAIAVVLVLISILTLLSLFKTKAIGG